MQLNIKKLLIIVAAASEISCAGVNFSGWHFPYMMPVQQGNIINNKEYSQIKIGMTKEEVSYIVGHPMTQFLFDQNRWDFDYQLYKNNNLEKSYDIVILFDKKSKVKYVNKNGELFSK